MNENQKIDLDLQKFIKAYEPNKYKVLKSGIEVRGINDIHRGLAFAREVISKLKLKLSINHTAEMTMYGGFEVLVN
ncbi:MAG: hypothetical protein EOO07_13340 [Chitinophagaceae bacterium]|nr:MAG: hypothetical protein EOO07_13340 [Chitinophagaceae bacterium]